MVLSENEVKSDIKKLSVGFYNCIKKINEFEILDEQLVPEGLKPHTRSIAWLVEQVVVQGIRKYIHLTEFDNVIANESDIELHDCTVKIGNNDLLVNIKVTNIDNSHSRNDINKAYKIFKAFSENPDKRLYYVVIKLSFNNTKIKFMDNPIVFYIPWIHDVYVNPSNHHLQASYYLPQTIRTVKQFVDEIEQQIISKKLPRK